ncbi:MAG: nicotinate (nicotinamide) nucleotide adenylyltransferase [Planctomycetota bacterium]
MSEDHADHPITPWPAPAGSPVLLFGGSFDPPHAAHVRLALDAQRSRAAGTWLVVIPAARSPHKDAGPAVSTADRLAMLRLAFAGYPNVAIWTDEFDRAASGAPSYFVETLERASQIAADAELSFAIGTDQAASLHRWERPRRILELAAPVILPRKPITDRESLRQRLCEIGFWTDDERERLINALAETPIIEISSTDIRAGDDRHLPAEVADYIARHRLYRSG